MEMGSHRLTVREFEQCIIAGADLFENDEDEFCNFLESDVVADDRYSVADVGYGSACRDETAMNEDEQYLCSVFGRLQMSQPLELMKMRYQEPGDLESYFRNKRNPEHLHGIMEVTTELTQVLRTVRMDDMNGLEDPEQPEFKPNINWVIGALTQTMSTTGYSANGKLLQGDTDGPSDFDVWCDAIPDQIHHNDGSITIPQHKTWS